MDVYSAIAVAKFKVKFDKLTQAQQAEVCKLVGLINGKEKTQKKLSSYEWKDSSQMKVLLKENLDSSYSLIMGQQSQRLSKLQAEDLLVSVSNTDNTVVMSNGRKIRAAQTTLADTLNNVANDIWRRQHKEKSGEEGGGDESSGAGEESGDNTSTPSGPDESLGSNKSGEGTGEGTTGNSSTNDEEGEGENSTGGGGTGESTATEPTPEQPTEPTGTSTDQENTTDGS